MRTVDADEIVLKIKPLIEAERQIYNLKASWNFAGKCLAVVESTPTVSADPEWIPCSKRLPEPGEYYLVTKEYCTGYREIDIAKYCFDGWYKADTVLAWRELPKPYKEGEKE